MPPNKIAEWAKWLGFRTFDDPSLAQMVGMAAQWTIAFRKRQPARWLTLMGSSGCGKTHIGKRLFTHAKNNSPTGKTISQGDANYHSDTDYIPYVVYWPEFVQQLRGGEAFKKRDDMKRWPVLMLDDIGAERDTTGFAIEELNTLLGVRVGKWTILTSNQDLDYFERVETRIASRIMRPPNLHLTIKAEDYGLRK